MSQKSWIQNAVIYEVYPMTFNYAKGSETDPYKGAYGNLKGITEKVDYIENLGVDAVWICPFYKWNRTGFGYDITDYEEVSPMYGSLKDFKELTETFHKKDVKVLIDQVLNHCSMEHEWFQKSVHKEEPYTDYFIWKDPQGFNKDGKPIEPNNWPSTWDSSGESAWAWNEERQQFYMHSFDYTMPNLNINNPRVQKRLLQVAKHWFDLGADGFRLDGTSHYGYNPKMLDNPIIGKETTPFLRKDLVAAEEGQQMRIYDVNNEIGKSFIDKLDLLAKSYNPPKVLLSEYVFDKGFHANLKGRQVIRESACDTFYTGALRGGLSDFRGAVEEMLKPQKKDNKNFDPAISETGAKINWALSNHDMERVASRWFGENPKPEEIKLATKLLVSLPGSICLFQGEELGLGNPDIAETKNLSNDPLKLSPMVNMPWDAARASLPWTARGTNLWLKPTKEQCTKAVDLQEKDPDSILNVTRNVIKWRKTHHVLNHIGTLDFIETSTPEVIAFKRTNEKGESVSLAFNFSDKPVAVKFPTNNNGQKSIIVKPYQALTTDSTPLSPLLHRQR